MTCKSLKKKIKKVGFLCFSVSQEKWAYNIFQKFVVSNSISKKTRRTLKSVGANPGVIYGLCKVYKHIVYNCPSC